MKKWNTDQIGDLSGKKVIITGAARGIGFATAKAFAGKGAEVIMAVRNQDVGREAVEKIRHDYPDAKISAWHLDLGDLGSVADFAAKVVASHKSIDLLINNAGVMIPPLSKTRDGFESQFGINHLGHFALTGRLLPLLKGTRGSRVVTVSSIASRSGKISFDNLNGDRGYNPMKFYQQSKLANLLFAVELSNRIKKNGANPLSLACHPGISATNLMSRGSGREVSWLMKQMMKVATQPAEKGALPTLFAATHPDLKGGEYVGPDGWRSHRGHPVVSDEVHQLFNAEVAEKLWHASEDLTGVKYNI